MRKISIVLALTAVFSTSSILAHDHDMSSASKPCAHIAKACLDAGFVRAESKNKNFWHDCMRPLVLGHTVEKVTVSADDVKTCRANKIEEMKSELKELGEAAK